ncbi:MAG: acyltransferase [Desulfobacteraceae bacterium]|nr:MAG: acyltransferase [Desulfobacteraceae bacterium]
MEFEIADMELMGENVKPRLKRCGDGVRIYPLAKLAFPHVIELGSHCRIRDFVFIFAGKGVVIGEYSDMQPHSVIWGGGTTIIGDRVSVGPGTVLLSAVYSHAKGLKMVDGLEEGSSEALYGTLVIKDDVYIGANCSLMPNIVIGEGAVIGAGSFVNKDVDPWTIVAGSPARKINMRPK